MRPSPVPFLVHDAVDAPTTGTIAQVLKRLVIAANSLVIGNAGIELDVFGTTAANANNKTVRVLLGTTVLITTGALAANNRDWHINVKLYRTGASAFESIANGQANAAIVATDFVAGAENLSLAANLDVEGTTPTAAADLTVTGFYVRQLP